MEREVIWVKCPSCNYVFGLATVPSNGIATCPSCGHTFVLDQNLYRKYLEEKEKKARNLMLLFLLVPLILLAVDFILSLFRKD
ncbi:MAG: hypothetical protein DRN04_05555 [Thermoprotei archaeon]|nr:MAG: hypothetical protein DRN04_05555 [Thermoprotei archaeon]